MKKINWGIIGLGSIASQFANGFKHADNAKLLGIASKTSSKLRKFQEDFRISNSYSYDNYEGLIENAEIDIMKFCTDITDDEWTAIYEFLKQLLPKESKEMKTLNKFTQLSSPAMQKKLQYPFDFNIAQKLRNKAIDDGFIVTN